MRFVGADNNIHYGWLRCDVKEDGSILVLKDFAYETIPEYPILPGSVSTYQDIAPGNITGDIYASGSTIHVNVPQRPTLSYDINIYNLVGQPIYTSQNENPFVTIQLEAPRGIYIVEVISGKEKLSKQVIIV